MYTGHTRITEKKSFSVSDLRSSAAASLASNDLKPVILPLLQKNREQWSDGSGGKVKGGREGGREERREGRRDEGKRRGAWRYAS